MYMERYHVCYFGSLYLYVSIALLSGCSYTATNTRYSMICSLEIFHAVILKWAPKRVHFSYNGMRARVQSACLSHNANIGRAHAKTKEGVLRYRLEYTKSTKWPRSCTTMSCNFLKDLLNDVHTTILGIRNGTRHRHNPMLPNTVQSCAIVSVNFTRLFVQLHWCKACAHPKTQILPESRIVINRVCQLFSTFCMHMYQ